LDRPTASAEPDAAQGVSRHDLTSIFSASDECSELVPAAVDVAVGITHFAAVEVFGVAVPALAGRFTAVGKFAVISVLGTEAGIDMAIEVFAAVVPGAGTDEYAAVEPLRAVIAIGRAIVRRDGVVAIRANGSRSDVDAYLGIRAWSGYE
jgi:hypothetical protein